MEMLQKHIFARDLMPAIEKMIQEGVIRILQDLDDDNYLYSVIKYALSNGSVIQSEDDFIGLLTASMPKKEEEIMTIADQLIAKGEQRGLKKGQEEAQIKFARFLISEGKSLEYISQATELPVDKIKENVVH